MISADRVRPSLNERQRLLIALIADGASVNDAADRLKVRKGYVLSALQSPLIKAELALLRDALRASAQPEAVNKLIETMRQPGNREVSDRRLQYDAARAILGEDAKAPTVNVGVQVNNQLGQIRPGYVIRLPADSEPVSENPALSAQTIQHTQ